MPQIPYFGRLILAILVIMAISQFQPELVNYLLVLVLVGVLLSKSAAFQRLIVTISTVGKKV